MQKQHAEVAIISYCDVILWIGNLDFTTDREEMLNNVLAWPLILLNQKLSSKAFQLRHVCSGQNFLFILCLNSEVCLFKFLEGNFQNTFYGCWSLVYLEKVYFSIANHTLKAKLNSSLSLLTLV